MHDGEIPPCDRILLAHGSGGLLMRNLIEKFFLRYLCSPELLPLDDAAELSLESTSIAFTTDMFVVKPIFFPGGDIGSLAVSGTVNDLLMKGARPGSLSLGLILEEGFPLAHLERILESIRQTCDRAGVRIVTGDTKVVGRGEADGVYINTAGVGCILPQVKVSGANARPGDAVIVSGSVGRHGIAVMAERNGLHLRVPVLSDAMPMTQAVLPLLERFPKALHVLRDPTRGGVAATLNEIASSSGVSIVLTESTVPIDDTVSAVCDLLGFDPLYLPCEGRFIAVVEPSAAADIIAFLTSLDDCRDAAIIGEVTGSPSGEVHLLTASGVLKILDLPTGEMLPRIC